MRGTARPCFLALTLTLAGPGAGRAASYDFLAAPETDLNRIYRLDKATGEMGACQYGLSEATVSNALPSAEAVPGHTVGEGTAAANAAEGIGVTLCYPPGEGGGPQSQSEYALIASRHAGEGGVFRVDVRTGTMSICYVLKERVVCTAPKK
jgi:hypothetical protein